MLKLQPGKQAQPKFRLPLFKHQRPLAETNNERELAKMHDARRKRRATGIVVEGLAMVLIATSAVFATWHFSQKPIANRAQTKVLNTYYHMESAAKTLPELQKMYEALKTTNAELAAMTSATIMRHYGLSESEAKAMLDISRESNLPITRLYSHVELAFVNHGGVREAFEFLKPKFRIGEHGWRAPGYYAELLALDAVLAKMPDPSVQSAVKKVREKVRLGPLVNDMPGFFTSPPWSKEQFNADQHAERATVVAIDSLFTLELSSKASADAEPEARIMNRLLAPWGGYNKTLKIGLDYKLGQVENWRKEIAGTEMPFGAQKELLH